MPHLEFTYKIFKRNFARRELVNLNIKENHFDLNLLI